MNINTPINIPNPLILSDILFRKDKRIQLFLALDQEKRIEILPSLTMRVKKDIFQHLPDDDLVKILEAIDPDEATDALQMLGKQKRERVLVHISRDLKSALSTLLEFDPETAAGLMTLDYVRADEKDTITDVSKKFKQHEKLTGRPPVIVVTKNEKFFGFLPGHELGFAGRTEKIIKYVKRMPSISYAANHDEVFRKFRSHPHAKVAVLNDSNSVIGIIYSDDVLKLIEENPSSSLYDFAGIKNEESVTDTAKQKFHNRYRWLIINLFTGFLAAFTIGLFEETLSKYVLLAIYMPIVAGMGGNAATQTLAVQVRGISLNQVDYKTISRTLKNEMGAAFFNGILNGLLVAAIVILINGDFQIAIILALAMVINLQVAAFFGTIVPLVMSKLGKDPAASATIFITTATDVLGFLAFLGLATLVLT